MRDDYAIKNAKGNRRILPLSKHHRHRWNESDADKGGDYRQSQWIEYVPFTDARRALNEIPTF